MIPALTAVVMTGVVTVERRARQGKAAAGCDIKLLLNSAPSPSLLAASLPGRTGGQLSSPPRGETQSGKDLSERSCYAVGLYDGRTVESAKSHHLLCQSESLMEIPVHDVVNTGTELFREGTQGFINVCLARESASQPWGFRLQGGKDRGLPFQLLKVSSVFQSAQS